MTLEALLYRWFTEYKDLAELLATFENRPAVFFQFAPGDNQKGWGTAGQYPRIVYAIDMQADQERKSAGTMEISLLCDETGMPPEIIEPKIKKCLKDLLILPNGGYPYCFAWARTDSFEISSRENGNDTRVIGMDIRFDIIEYDSQETTDPDPIAGLNQFIKGIYDNSLVIGLDRLEDIIVTSTERPVFYCHLDSVTRDVETNQVVWMKGVLSVHVLCPDAAIRRKLTMALAQQLSLDGEVILVDKSPMFVERLQVNYKADYLKNGQLIVNVRYGVLRPTYKEKQLMASVGVVR